MIHVVLVGRLSRFANCFLSLALAADEKDLLAFAGDACEEVRRFVETLEGFIEVDDVNPALIFQQIRLHLRIPFFCLVTIVDTGIYHFSNEFVNHIYYRLSRLKAERALVKDCRMKSLQSLVVSGSSRRGAENMNSASFGK